MHKREVFDWIAPFYELFFNQQRRFYQRALKGALKKLNLDDCKKIIDVGCGTGSLCSLLNQMDHEVTGIDRALGMLEIAAKHPENVGVTFIQANILERTPFVDKSFDVAIAAYVAHGLISSDRKLMYSEMSRITKNIVIIYDYNKKRSLFVDIIEWLEGGDYFNFIKSAEAELKVIFRSVSVIKVSNRSNCFICCPKVDFSD